MNTKGQDNQRQAILYAYLAGLLDGEGTIRICKSIIHKHPNRNPFYTASIGIVNTDKIIVQLFHKTFGGNRSVRKDTECVPNRQPIYRWGTCGNKGIMKIIDKLFPYLRIKKPQAKLVKEFCEKKNDWIKKGGKKGKPFKQNSLPISELQRREELYQKIKKFNAVGAAAETKQKDA